ncbi:DNA glycosylase AlkZ-like family protein [Ornithinimicrobium sufpigmenti]|uniref:DNA glycosylase AlkZ-like family protein n=1 Tax=Ornithinimicrobium sufpigmenti TaxID=2508882 RepID=UPI0010362BE9|nr:MULTISPECIES: crosslink repair DNA glycosylase YcaQ family protein [unclassified Ornithinimicrobium]
MTGTVQASVSWEQALSWRLSRHLLDPAGAESAAGVVRRLGAVLSMDETLAELALRTRSATIPPGGLGAALAAGEVIKAFAFRGAVHYLSPEEGGVYLALRAAGRQWELPSWVEHYQLTAAQWPDFRAAVQDAVADGPLTSREIGEVLARHRDYRHLQPVFDEGAATLIKPLTWQGDVSIGPPRGGRLTLQRLDGNPRWAGIPDLDDAGPRAILAYLGTYGPATFDHIHYWLGAGLSAGRRRLVAWWDGLAGRLAEVDVAGTRAYVVREQLDAMLAARPSEAVRLLPGHDQWVIGPGTRDTPVTPTSLRQLMTRKANPVVLGGVVRGTWVRKHDRLTVHCLDGGPAPTEELRQEADRLAGILGVDLQLSVVAGHG